MNKLFLAILISTPFINLAKASELAIPNVFSAGTPAVAADVNANFEATALSVNDNDARISSNDARISDAVARIDALLLELESLKAENAQLASAINELQIAGLKDVLSLGPDEEGRPTVTLSGVNLVLNNGEESSESANGLGNLIIGYNEKIPPEEVDERLDTWCTDPDFYSQENCESNGAVYGANHRSGSHNIILGPKHSYSQYGNLVTGSKNTITGIYSSISGVRNSEVFGDYSSITGGSQIRISGDFSNVSGGAANRALSNFSSISGGIFNVVVGSGGSISGGQRNTVSGDYASISGGFANRANAPESSVSGGAENKAEGPRSAISGGTGITVDQENQWQAGDIEYIPVP